MYLEKFKQLLAKSSIGGKKRACTPQDISFLEEKLETSLPLAYKEFLLWGGRDAGRLWEGSDYAFQELIELQEDAVDLLEENNFSIPLPDDAFVFWMHQGYQFMFFKFSEGDNPPVYFFKEFAFWETRNSFEKIFNSFSECLIGVVEHEVMLRKEMYQNKNT